MKCLPVSGVRGGGLAFLALSMLSLTAPSLAQTAPAIPAGQTREELNRVPVGPDTRAPSRLTVSGGDIERAPCPLADPRFAGVTITFTGAEFKGLRIVSPEDLRPAYQGFIGKTVPIAAVCEIRDAAATILRRRGYLAAVQVPPQQIDNGVVKFDVLMAKIVAIQVRGDAGRAEPLIASYLQQLKSQEAFNEIDAQRYLLLARDLPGYDIRLTLRPAGTVPGELVGEVQVVRTPFVIDANIQNYGSKAVGRFGGLVRTEIYDLIGAGDRLTAGFFATPQFDEQHVLQLGYDMRLGHEGLTVSGRFAYAWSEPDINQPGLAVKAKTLIAGGEVSYPLLRTLATNVRLAGGLEYVDQRNYLAVGTNPFALQTRDKLSVAYARLDVDALDRASISSTTGYSAAEPRWHVAGSLELRRGLDIFGATDRCGALSSPKCSLPEAGSRPLGDATAFVARLSGIAEYRPTPLVAFSLAPRAQWTPDRPFQYERFSAGNYTIGRGYDPGTIVGDSGIGFQAEVRLGSLMPRSLNAITFQPYAFFDKIWLWSRNDLPRLQGTGPDPQQLSTAGFGFRSAFGDHARLDVYLALPVDRSAPIERLDRRLMVSFTTRLWPWRN
jgi:hemolysin activation/secretion protein